MERPGLARTENGEVEALMHITNVQLIPPEVMDVIRFSSFLTVPNLKNQLDEWNDGEGEQAKNLVNQIKCVNGLTKALIDYKMKIEEGYTDSNSREYSRNMELLKLAVELMEYRQQVGGKHGGA